MTSTERPLFTEDTGRRDADLVRAAIAGDNRSFGRLVEAYQRPAVSKAYRLLGNSEDAAEVVQEAFLRAYRALARLKEPARFGPWLMRIVSNLSLNARRSRKTSQTLMLEEERGTDGLTSGEGEPVVASFGPDAEAQGREMQRLLDEALAELPEKQRLSLVLFTIEGWAQKDIAEYLECSLENVKWNVFQARKRLREKLGELLEP
ncbi:MAG: RNA polymerase sigma factor [Phycisphaerae bacterium]|jgi:RNA polymerase sigma-70 factor (ECF subfamily)